MNRKKWWIVALVAAVLLVVVLAVVYVAENRSDSYEDRETFREETFVAVGDAKLTFSGNLSTDAYPVGTATGDWLIGCAASDRDEQFDAYVLRHEATEGDTTTFTYLIYYPHEGTALTVTPEVLEGENGYRIDLTYTEGTGTEGYTLCRLSVELPTTDAPRVRLLVDDDTLGTIVTGTTEPIPEGAN